MSVCENRSAYVRSPWMVEVRDNPIPEPGYGQVRVDIRACGLCGTDLHTADRMAAEWEPFGHEVAGIVEAVGDGVTRLKTGDRVALHVYSACGKCPTCLPPPYGRNRPEACRSFVTWWAAAHMGFGERLLAPQECVLPIPDDMPFDVACVSEPVSISIDLVEKAGVGPGDNVLIMGPGPLGLGAVLLSLRAGAGHVSVAGLSGSKARLASAKVLGADEIILVDKTPLGNYDFGAHAPDKILVTSPPQTLLQAFELASDGAVIAYVSIAWGPEASVTFDTDKFLWKRLSLVASMPSPDVQAGKAIRLMQTAPELGAELISHRFGLEEIGEAVATARDDGERTVKKMVMVR